IPMQRLVYCMSHHVNKAAEASIGFIQCLPGCFSLFRLSALIAVFDKLARVPANGHDHMCMKLGEDRFISVLLRLYGFEMRYCADAIVMTHAPESVGDLLVQQRRWINSTVHVVKRTLQYMADLVPEDDNDWEVHEAGYGLGGLSSRAAAAAAAVASSAGDAVPTSQKTMPRLPPAPVVSLIQQARVQRRLRAASPSVTTFRRFNLFEKYYTLVSYMSSLFAPAFSVLALVSAATYWFEGDLTPSRMIMALLAVSFGLVLMIGFKTMMILLRNTNHWYGAWLVQPAKRLKEWELRITLMATMYQSIVFMVAFGTLVKQTVSNPTGVAAMQVYIFISLLVGPQVVYLEDFKLTASCAEIITFFFMTPFLYMIVPVYAFLNSDDGSWGTRENEQGGGASASRRLRFCETLTEWFCCVRHVQVDERAHSGGNPAADVALLWQRLHEVYQEIVPKKSLQATDMAALLKSSNIDDKGVLKLRLKLHARIRLIKEFCAMLMTMQQHVREGIQDAVPAASAGAGADDGEQAATVRMTELLVNAQKHLDQWNLLRPRTRTRRSAGEVHDAGVRRLQASAEPTQPASGFMTPPGSRLLLSFPALLEQGPGASTVEQLLLTLALTHPDMATRTQAVNTLAIARPLQPDTVNALLDHVLEHYPEYAAPAGAASLTTVGLSAGSAGVPAAGGCEASCPARNPFCAVTTTEPDACEKDCKHWCAARDRFVAAVVALVQRRVHAEEHGDARGAGERSSRAARAAKSRHLSFATPTGAAPRSLQARARSLAVATLLNFKAGLTRRYDKSWGSDSTGASLSIVVHDLISLRIGLLEGYVRVDVINTVEFVGSLIGMFYFSFIDGEASFQGYAQYAEDAASDISARAYGAQQAADPVSRAADPRLSLVASLGAAQSAMTRDAPSLPAVAKLLFDFKTLTTPVNSVLQNVADTLATTEQTYSIVTDLVQQTGLVRSMDTLLLRFNLSMQLLASSAAVPADVQNALLATSSRTQTIDSLATSLASVTKAQFLSAATARLSADMAAGSATLATQSSLHSLIANAARRHSEVAAAISVHARVLTVRRASESTGIRTEMHAAVSESLLAAANVMSSIAHRTSTTSPGKLVDSAHATVLAALPSSKRNSAVLRDLKSALSMVDDRAAFTGLSTTGLPPFTQLADCDVDIRATNATRVAATKFPGVSFVTLRCDAQLLNSSAPAGSPAVAFTVPRKFSTFLPRYVSAVERVQKQRTTIRAALLLHAEQLVTASRAFIAKANAPLATRSLNVGASSVASQYAAAEALTRLLAPAQELADQLVRLPTASTSVTALGSQVTALDTALTRAIASREAACSAVMSVNSTYSLLVPRLKSLLNATAAAAGWIDSLADIRNAIQSDARAQRIRLGGADGERLLSDAGMSGSLVRVGSVRPLQAGLARTGFDGIGLAFSDFQASFARLSGSQSAVSNIMQQATTLLTRLTGSTSQLEAMRNVMDTLARVSDQVGDIPAVAKKLHAVVRAVMPVFIELPQVPAVVDSIADIRQPLTSLINGLQTFNRSTFPNSRREPLAALTSSFRGLVQAVDDALPSANVSMTANELSMALYAFRDTQLKSLLRSAESIRQGRAVLQNIIDQGVALASVAPVCNVWLAGAEHALAQVRAIKPVLENASAAVTAMASPVSTVSALAAQAAAVQSMWQPVVNGSLASSVDNMFARLETALASAVPGVSCSNLYARSCISARAQALNTINALLSTTFSLSATHSVVATAAFRQILDVSTADAVEKLAARFQTTGLYAQATSELLQDQVQSASAVAARANAITISSTLPASLAAAQAAFQSLATASRDLARQTPNLLSSTLRFRVAAAQVPRMITDIMRGHATIVK
ncbi:MAG: hypothetical protein EOO41_00140, partial [Methanobacteriota archaeon]